MDISAGAVKELREKTGAGIMDCKKALQDADGNMDKAAEILRQKGLATSAKVAGREAKQGLIESYIHTGGRIGNPPTSSRAGLIRRSLAQPSGIVSGFDRTIEGRSRRLYRHDREDGTPAHYR